MGRRARRPHRRRRRGKNGRNGHASASENGDSEAEASPASSEDDEHGEGEDAAPQSAMAEAASSDTVSEEVSEDNGSSDHLDAPSNGSSGNGEDEVESVGAEDALDEVRTRRKPMRKQYKIQEVSGPIRPVAGRQGEPQQGAHPTISLVAVFRMCEPRRVRQHLAKITGQSQAPRISQYIDVPRNGVIRVGPPERTKLVKPTRILNAHVRTSRADMIRSPRLYRSSLSSARARLYTRTSTRFVAGATAIARQNFKRI